MTDITAGDFIYTPGSSALGNPFDSFTFEVENNGGTANGGVDTDPNPKTMTIDVVVPNQPPSSADNSVTTLENTPYVFQTSDFPFNDPNSPAFTLNAVEITSVPTAGALTDNASGTAVLVTAGTFVSVADISSGHLVFTATTDTSGTGYANFTFQVQNDGGTLAGGVDTDPTANTMTINVTFVNQPPSGANKTISIGENSAYVFQQSDFGFSDPNIPANSFNAVEITTLPSNGAPHRQ